ncbi:MAG: hypothetical protein QOF99_5157 [Pseudonocardiales bacterium]|nr:hypothetical protein [Pseudonocardiales bacterium]
MGPNGETGKWPGLSIPRAVIPLAVHAEQVRGCGLWLKAFATNPVRRLRQRGQGVGVWSCGRDGERHVP